MAACLQRQPGQEADPQVYQETPANPQDQQGRDGHNQGIQVIDQPVPKDDPVDPVHHRLGHVVDDPPKGTVDIPVGQVRNEPQNQDDDEEADDERRRRPEGGDHHGQNDAHRDGAVAPQGDENVVHHRQDRQSGDGRQVQRSHPQGKTAEPIQIGVGDLAQKLHRPAVPGPAEPGQHDPDENQDHIQTAKARQNVHERTHKYILTNFSPLVEYGGLNMAFFLTPSCLHGTVKGVYRE